MHRVDAKPLPSAQYIRECFDYVPTTGVLIWRERPVSHFPSEHRRNNINARFAGHIAGSVGPRGYVIVSLADQRYLAHRVIWKLVTGTEPPPHVDHKDTNPSNNQWENLRGATKQQNGFNRTASRLSKTGIKGVNWDAERKRFAAYIRISGKNQFLGRFDNADEAGAAYQSAARQFHGEFAHQ